VTPPDARVTLDVSMDGVRDVSSVYLGDAGTRPASLPCDLGREVDSVRNPFCEIKGDRAGCYVVRLGAPKEFLADDGMRGGVKTAGEKGAFTRWIGQPRAIIYRELGKEGEGAVQGLDKEHRKALKALGYIH
jgi:hypothetical protein